MIAILKRVWPYLAAALAVIGWGIALVFGIRRPKPTDAIPIDLVRRKADADARAEVHHEQAAGAERVAIEAEAHAAPQPTAADEPMTGDDDAKARVLTDRFRGL